MLVQRITEWAASQPGRPALIDGDVRISYAQLARMIEATRRHLQTENLPAGAFAAVFSRTATERWVTALALRVLGLNAICVPSLEIAVQLGIRNLACVAVTQEASSRTRTLPPALRESSLIVIPQTLFNGGVGAAPPVRPGDGRPYGGHLLYTSGTTGTYKKVLFDGVREEGALLWLADAMSLDRNTVFHAVDFPPWTALSARCTPGVWFQGGCVVVSHEGPDRFHDFMRHRPTHTLLIPSMLPQLLAARRDTDRPETDLDMSVGGGFVPLSMAQRAIQRMTPKLNILYGSTEVVALLRSRFESLEDLHWLAPHKSVVQIVDGDGNECAVGAEGELRVGVRTFDCPGYLDDAETTAKFYRGGYFYPGDLAVKREDGRIRVIGRTEDVVNIRGWKHAAAPLEERIQGRLGVDAVCIFSELDEAGEDRILIALETDRRPSDEDLSAAIKDEKGFDRIRWVFLKSFPRTQTGMNKVNRRQLRTLVS